MTAILSVAATSAAVTSAAVVAAAATASAAVAVEKNQRDYNYPEALAVLKKITKASHVGYISSLKKSKYRIGIVKSVRLAFLRRTLLFLALLISYYASSLLGVMPFSAFDQFFVGFLR